MRQPSPNREVLVDLRSLQSPEFQNRGVGIHITALLRTRAKTAASGWRLIGLTDSGLGALPDDVEELCDEIAPSLLRPIPRRPTVFVDASPMTHSPVPTLRFMKNPLVMSAAIVYDFIPLDRDGYFLRTADRIDYFARLARLRQSDIFFPISQYSARRLREILGIPESLIHVTGASVRESLHGPLSADATQPMPSRHNRHGSQPYFMTVGGGDRRKNIETAVEAVRLLRSEFGLNLRLKVVGHYGEAYLAELKQIASKDGPGGFVEFLSGLSDSQMRRLYAGAMAVIVPSLIEGFSLPVVEAAMCGTPAVVSDCDAHLELVAHPQAIFPATNPQALASRLEALYRREDLRTKLLDSQAFLREKFREGCVGQRFWHRVVEEAEVRFFASPDVPGFLHSKPVVAILSPYPPDKSGVAQYTARTIQAAAACLDVHLYTNARRPLSGNGFVDAGPPDVRAFTSGDYQATISVLGNSDFHLPILSRFKEYGGPCIMHDSRLTQLYHHSMGAGPFTEMASNILQRRVTPEDVTAWLKDDGTPTLFLEEIVEHACPLIVHSNPFREILRQHYGVQARVIPFCPNIDFGDDELAENARCDARSRLGLGESFVVATFGFVDIVSKGIAVCLSALDHLRSWNIPAELYCVGSSGSQQAQLKQMAQDLGVATYFHLHPGFVDAERYQLFLRAVDAGVQLRSYGLGQPSAALADCIAAGLPSVANAALAEACASPSYVYRIPDRLSPLLLAQQLAHIYDARLNRQQTAIERKDYVSRHNFHHYVEKLCEALDLI